MTVNNYTNIDLMFLNYCQSHLNMSLQDSKVIRGRAFSIRKQLTEEELKTGDERYLTDIYRARIGSKVAKETERWDRRAIRCWRSFSAYREEYGI